MLHDRANEFVVSRLISAGSTKQSAEPSSGSSSENSSESASSGILLARSAKRFQTGVLNNLGSSSKSLLNR